MRPRWKRSNLLYALGDKELGSLSSTGLDYHVANLFLCCNYHRGQFQLGANVQLRARGNGRKYTVKVVIRVLSFHFKFSNEQKKLSLKMLRFTV